MKDLISELLDAEVGSPQFTTKLEHLDALVSAHVEEEEIELFPRVRGTFSEEELMAIGTQLRVAEEELNREGEPRAALHQEMRPSV